METKFTQMVTDEALRISDSVEKPYMFKLKGEDTEGGIIDVVSYSKTHIATYAAAPELLAALGHACDWIHDAPHGDNCHVSNQYEGDPGAGCNCGKDSIQKYIFNTITKATGA